MGEDNEASEPWPEGHKDFAYLDTMNEVLVLAIEFAEQARNSDDVRIGMYLKLSSRCMRCALELYGEHLTQTSVEMEAGEDLLQ